MASASAAEAHESMPPPGGPHTEKLAEGVHACIQPDGGWCLSNAGEAAREAGPGTFGEPAPGEFGKPVPGESAELADSERLVANIHRACAELDGRLPKDALGMPSVRADMEQLGGGRPVACHA